MAMINRKEAKTVYDYLNNHYNVWYFAKGKEKDRVEESIRYYLNHTISGDLYSALAEGHGGGLCAPGHFDYDYGRCLNVLQKILEEHK